MELFGGKFHRVSLIASAAQRMKVAAHCGTIALPAPRRMPTRAGRSPLAKGKKAGSSGIRRVLPSRQAWGWEAVQELRHPTRGRHSPRWGSRDSPLPACAHRALAESSTPPDPPPRSAASHSSRARCPSRPSSREPMQLASPSPWRRAPVTPSAWCRSVLLLLSWSLNRIDRPRASRATATQ